MAKDKIGQKLEVGDRVAFVSEIKIKLSGLVLDVKGGYLQHGIITKITTYSDYVSRVSYDLEINNKYTIEPNKCIKINNSK